MTGRYPTSRSIARIAWTPYGGAQSGVRITPEEAAIALVFDGGTEAVMMATPDDLEDFGVGFALTEGIVSDPADIESIEIVEAALGVEIRMGLAHNVGAALAGRRRVRAGPVGCGLCGVDSLEAALPSLRRVESNLAVRPDQVLSAMQAMSVRQPLGEATRAVHAAAFYHPDEGVMAVREDVGRHNALDKLAGALASSGRDFGVGVLLLSSRLSVDLVQKAARIGAPVIACVSAPTALSLRAAQDANISIAAVVRDDGFEIFTGPERFSLSFDESPNG